MRQLIFRTVSALLVIGVCRADLAPMIFDPAVKPQDDFYRYVNGPWLKMVEIPAGAARWGTRIELASHNRELLKVLCERASAQGDQGRAIERMVGDFYASGMDPEAVEAAGAEPLRFEFDRLDALQTPADVLAEIAHLQGLGVEVGFKFQSAISPREGTKQIAEVDQGGLGLPDRDFYGSDQLVREKYAAHIAKMFLLLGGLPQRAPSEAAAVVQLETLLAGGSFSPAQFRDRTLNTHLMTMAEATAAIPDLDWRLYFARTGAPVFNEFNLGQPDFFRVFAKALKERPVVDWQAYLRWHFIHAFAPFLSSNFARENFAFYGTALAGETPPSSRWPQVVGAIDATMGEALAQLYVETYCSPSVRSRAQTLVSSLRAILRERIAGLGWMDEPTRARALAKLDALTVRVGYPDSWRDYQGLVIDRGPYVLNVLKARAFEARRQLRKIGQPGDTSEWPVSPASVTSYYNPINNEIIIPAGMLQAPFFDPKADDAVNFGALGVAIGRDLVRGFDNRGRHFDERKNQSDWWSPATAAEFQKRAAGLVRQFDAYTVFADLPLSGARTFDENVADLGGVTLAYAAMEKALAGQPRTAIGGFTPEQRFFISDAAAGREVYRPEFLRQFVVSHADAPAEFRCNGPLSNFAPFAAAFQVPEGAPMRRPEADRISIW